MARMAASVVYSLPATISVRNLPLSRSRRKPDALMPPFGNASAAASASRSGVSSVMTGRSVISSSPCGAKS
jgi:hypothetical protein